MHWEILIAFVLGAAVATVPWLFVRSHTNKAMELLASRSFSDYSVGAARMAKAQQPTNNQPEDYSSAWSEENG